MQKKQKDYWKDCWMIKMDVTVSDQVCGCVRRKSEGKLRIMKMKVYAMLYYKILDDAMRTFVRKNIDVV